MSCQDNIRRALTTASASPGTTTSTRLVD